MGKGGNWCLLRGRPRVDPASARAVKLLSYHALLREKKDFGARTRGRGLLRLEVRGRGQNLGRVPGLGGLARRLPAVDGARGRMCQPVSRLID